MNAERWQQIERLYEAALRLDPGRRDSFLMEACAGDGTLRGEVERLLLHHPQIDRFIEEPAMEVAARQLAREGAGAPGPDLVGHRLLHYRVVQKIGEGGMGVVYRARDEHLNRDVAIKVLPQELVADPERKRRFVQEARAASALNHPNIVTIHDIASEGGCDFIVMEYVEGKTLDQKIGHTGMKFVDVLKCAIQIADALAATHATGIVHRDLKPANILVSEGGWVTVLDFGLAKLTQARSEGESDVASSMGLTTDEGRVLGTAAYMSPEQAQGKPVNARSDIFSFGSILYEMATGRRAFEGDGRLSTLSAILNREPARIGGDIPQEFEKLIAHCLCKDPAHRIQHMGDVRIALEDLVEDFGWGGVRKAGSHAKSARRRLAMWSSVAALAVLAAGGFVLYVRRATGPMPPLNVVPLTSYHGSQRNPSFSRDGSEIAFSWDGENRDNVDIYVQMVTGAGKPLRLTTHPDADWSPAWSPDGSKIAFRRGSFVYLITPLGGPEREFAHALQPLNPLAWAPDSRSIAMIDRERDEDPSAVYLVTIDSGAKVKLTSPPPGTWGDVECAFSPDGRNLAVRRIYSFFSSDIWVVQIQPGFSAVEPWRLTNDFCQTWGLTWTPDSREVVFSSDRGGRTSLWRVAAKPGAQVYRIAGTDDAMNPVISRWPPCRVAFARRWFDVNIWRMEIPQGGGPASYGPTRISSSSLRDTNPQISIDGSRLAFVSTQSGGLNLHVCRSDGSNPLQLTHFVGNRSAGAARWSPDGRQIVFDGSIRENMHLFLIGAEGGPMRQLTTGASNDVRPSFSADGHWIYFCSNRSGERQIWRMPAGGGEAIQVTRGGGWEALEAPDQRHLYYAKFNALGLWKVPIEGGDEVPVPGAQKTRHGLWAIADGGIAFLDGTAARQCEPVGLSFLSFDSGRISRIGIIPQIGDPGAVCFSITRDARWAYWTQTDRDESNLAMIDNFR